MPQPESENTTRPEEIRRVRQEILTRVVEELLEEFNQAQGDADEMKREMDDNVEEVKSKRDLPDKISGSLDKMGKAVEIKQVVQQTIMAIEEGALFPSESNSAQVIDKLVGQVRSKVTEASASYIYQLIDQGLRNQLNTSQQLISALENVSNLRYIDNSLFKEITQGFKRKAEGFGLTEDQRQRFEKIAKEGEVRESLLRERSRKAQDQQLRMKFERLFAKVMGSRRGGRETKGLLNHDNIHILEKDIKAKYARQLEDFSSSEKDRAIQVLLEQEKNEVLGKLRNEFLGLTGTPAPDLETLEDIQLARERNLDDFRAVVRNYQEKGILNETTAESLINQAQEIHNLLKGQYQTLEDQSGGLRPTRLEEEADRFISGVFDERQMEIIRGLNDINSLEQLIRLRYSNPDGTINWDEFYTAVKDIFEELFKVVENNPQEEFQRGFNPMYEGHFYDVLIKAITRLGRQLHDVPDEHPLKQTIKLWDFTDTGDTFKEDQTPEGGTSKLTYIKKEVELSFSEALETTLVHRMVRLRSITEFLHNVNVMVEFGGNFEQLAGYAERLSTADIDWLFQEDRYLVQAYGFYVTSLMQEMGENMRVVPTTFGKSDFTTGLDSTQKRAWYQLLAMSNCTGKERSKMARRVRMASGITKGVIGEFWGLLTASRMPINKKVVYKTDKDGKVIVENGQPVIERYETELVYGGLSQKGYEKMSGHLDLDLSLQRFGLPNFLRVLRYTPAPRDLNDISFDVFSHADIYRIAMESEDAFWQGRSDWLADFQDKNVILAEFFKRHGIDIFIRAGWRFYQYRSLLVFSRDDQGELIRDPRTRKMIIDFDKTMENLKEVGFYAVKTFIDDFFLKEEDYRYDVSDIDLDNLQDTIFRRYLDDYDPNKKLTKNQEKKLKEGLYSDFIFDRLLKIYPSVFIGIESRQHTPQNEEKVRDRIVGFLERKFPDYPREMVKDHLMPIFISSLSMAEKKVWELRKEQRDLDYIFSPNDLESVKEELIRLFTEYRKNEGEQELQGIKYRLSDISDDDYFQALKELLVDYRQFLEADRWSRNERKEKYRETLPQRYAYLMSQNMGMLDHLIGGFDFDFSKFFLQQGGNRLAARWLGETNVGTTKMNEAFKNIINRSIPELVKHEYHTLADFKKAVEETVAKNVSEFVQAYAENVGKEWAADELANYWAIFLGKMLGFDDKFRVPFIGGPLRSFLRRVFGTQGSLLTDAYKEAHDRKVTALDGEKLWILARTIAEKCNIHVDEKRIEGYKPVKIFGKKIPGFMKPIFGKNKYHMRQVEQALKVTPGWRFVEKYIPLIAWFFILIQLAMMYASRKKDEN